MRKDTIFFVMVAAALYSCGRQPDVGKDDRLSASTDNAVVQLTARERVLVNLKIDTVKMKAIAETIMLLGKATVDENKISVISARVEGRVGKLFVRNTGEEIKSGQALYSIYSEELLSDENEYLLTLKQQAEFPSQKNTIKELIQASKKKLLLWGMSEKQVAELEKTKSPSPLMTFYSHVSGYLAGLNISEGEYVNAGTVLFRIAQSNSVWVEAQVYPYELKYAEGAPEILIEFEALPGEYFKGKIVFNSPSFEQPSKISYLKIEIQNKDEKIRPGMMASVRLKANEKKALVIPKSAITPGEMPVVWIEKETGKYEMREIHTGIQTKTEVEVLHGIKEGEKIVSSGAYLINSAYILRNGANTMQGMKM